MGGKGCMGGVKGCPTTPASSIASRRGDFEGWGKISEVVRGWQKEGARRAAAAAIMSAILGARTHETARSVRENVQGGG